MFQLFEVLLLFNLYYGIQETKRERKKVKFSKQISRFWIKVDIMNIKRSLKCIPIKNILFLLKHASTQIEKFLLKKMVLVGFKKDIGIQKT